MRSHSTGRHRHRVGQRSEAVLPTLHLAGLAPGLGQASRHRVAAPAVRHRHQRVGGAGVVGEPGPSPRTTSGPDPLGHSPLEGGPGRRRHPRSRSGGRRRRPDHRTVEPGRPPRRWSASRCTGTGGPAGPRSICRHGSRAPVRGAPDAAASAHDDPGRAEPALAAARGHQGVRPALPSATGRARRGWSPGDRPAVGRG